MPYWPAMLTQGQDVQPYGAGDAATRIVARLRRGSRHVNVLYLNHYAGGPRYGMEYRPYYLAREWVRAGHRVTIVGASQSHVRAISRR